MAEPAEEISQQPDVREALDQTAGKKVKAQGKDKFWFITHALLVLAFAAAYFALGLKWLPLGPNRIALGQRLLRGAIFITILFAISKAVGVYAIGSVSDPSTRYTLKRIKRLIVGILIVLIAVSVLFVNWYGALISVGFISVIVGLSVQTPMASFIGWIYTR